MFDFGNVERNTLILKTVKIAILTYYTNFKIMNNNIKFNYKEWFFVILIGIFAGILRYDVNYIFSIITLILAISVVYSKNNIGKNIIATTISLGINYMIEMISIVIGFFIYKTFKMNCNDYSKLIMITILNIVLVYKIFKIKKFKYGILFLQKTNNNEFVDLVILNISVIILFSVIVISNSSIRIVNILVSLEIIIYAILMFITIKKSLQLYYKQKLLVQELEETKEELEKKKEEVKELEAENMKFSQRSHTLIHKQKSLEYKIEQMITKTEISKEEAAEIKDKIDKMKEEIYKEKESIELDKTGIVEIDDMLRYMQSECNKNKIEFILKLNGRIQPMTNNLIDKDDLETLLADHIRNAIIAVEHSENINRSIMVKLGKIDREYRLSKYDSGIEFKIETLKNLGKIPSTTHAEEGGTGMGFMNTFETLEKYKASLKIEEIGKPSKDNYTKVISIKFDNKNEYNIKSYRQEKIRKESEQIWEKCGIYMTRTETKQGD